jgi:hypothetical protein
MPLGQRQLFVYWRVSVNDLPVALRALRDWQSGLAAQQPGLHCGLYRRSGMPDADATVMESYAIESAQSHPGIDDAMCQHIDQAGYALLQRWLRSARHVEVFDALPA